MKGIRGEGASDRMYAWRLQGVPLAILVALFVAGAAITAGGVAARSIATISLGNLVTGILSWAIFFWIVLYAGIEYLVWRRTKNLGHRLQFLGAALLSLSPLQLWIPLLIGGWPAVFTPAGFVAAVLWMVTFPVGIALALIGYFHRGFRANDVASYRNVVVREGERIRDLTDGHTERTVHIAYPDLAGVDLRGSAPAWASFLGRAGLSLGHVVDESGITIRPATYTGIGTLRLWTAFVHAYWLMRRPEHLTWVRIGWDHRVKIHISRYDYARVGRPVAHHRLAENVADAFVSSLLAFSRGDYPESVSLASGQAPPSRRIRLPEPWHDRAGLAATIASALLVLAGLATAFTAAFTSPVLVPMGIADVEFMAAPPAGEPVDVYARITGVDAFWNHISSFYIHILSYFNETGGGTLEMRFVQGDRYGIRLGPFEEGTEVLFSLSATVWESGSSSGDSTSLAAGPFTMTIGRVDRDGSSGLAIGSLNHEVAPNGDVTFRVPITSSAAIRTAQLIAVIGWTVYPLNLTATSGSMFEATVPNLASASGLMPIQVMVAAQDSTWNSATSGPVDVEVVR